MGLEPDRIFQQFRQSPNGLTCKAWRERAAHNLAIARLYLSSKLVAIAILEALASGSEQRLPLTAWFGPLEQPTSWEERFAANQTCQVSQSLVEQQVTQIAEHGRTRPCHFDLVKSPFAAFLMRFLGFEQIKQLRLQAEALFSQQISSEQFLEQVPHLERLVTL